MLKPKVFMPPMQSKFRRDWDNQDFGTGRPKPSGDGLLSFDERGGVSMPEPVRFQFGISGAGKPNKGGV